jgi:tetratricopeptide (TPR) repeat protein
MPASRVLAVFCLLLTQFGFPTTPARAQQLTPEQWREDLQVLDEAIRTIHKSPFHTVSETDFRQMVQTLHEAIPTLSDTEIIVEMASIVAAVNDGHTRLTGWHRNAKWGFHSYPVALYWFRDGLYVRQAHPDYADLVGARVLRVGDYSAEQAQSMIERVVAADNSQGEVDGGPRYLISPEVMQQVGIIKNLNDPPYVLEKDGHTWTPTMKPLAGPWPGWTRGFVATGAGWIDAKDESDAPTPLWLRHVDRTFWFEYVADNKMLYVQQNMVRNDPAETLESFYGRVQQALEKNDVEKFVLDVRLNGGGNNYLNKPALTTMVRADAVAQTFTITGRQTFSACQNLVNELSRWTNTVFVGEPTGERVNFYGDTRSTELPNSGLSVRASWLWWQNMDPRDTRDALYPDLAADLTFADYANNRDPVMAIIDDFEAIPTVDAMVTLIEDGSREVAFAALREATHDPVMRHRNMEGQINQVGYQLLARNRPKDALAVFELNVEQFPDSWNAYDSLAEAYETSGELERALQLFQKSLSLNPESPTGLQAVERLEGQGVASRTQQD